MVLDSVPEDFQRLFHMALLRMMNLLAYLEAISLEQERARLLTKQYWHVVIQTGRVPLSRSNTDDKSRLRLGTLQVFFPGRDRLPARTTAEKWIRCLQDEKRICLL